MTVSKSKKKFTTSKLSKLCDHAPKVITRMSPKTPPLREKKITPEEKRLKYKKNEPFSKQKNTVLFWGALSIETKNETGNIFYALLS